MRRVAFFVILAAAAACAIANRVSIQPVADPGQPVFRLTDATGENPPYQVYGLTVTPCGRDSAFWTIALTGENSSAREVTYGQLPPGYSAVVPAKPLTAGCYNLFVSGTEPTQFHMRADGEVIEFVRTDSIKAAQLAAREKARQDSIAAAAFRDSVAKVRRDSIAVVRTRQDSIAKTRKDSVAKTRADSVRKPPHR